MLCDVVVSGAGQAATSDVHWGAITAGVGGIATAGALLVSLVLLRQAMRDQRRARADRHREHASHVAFWAELSGYDDRIGVVAIRAHYANTSLQPAMNILMLAGIRGDVWTDARTADDADHQEIVDELSLVAIGPGDQNTRSFRLRGLPGSVVQKVEQYDDDAVIGELHFTDGAGVDWVKTSRGLLIERSSPLWLSLIPLSLSARDAALREAEAGKGGIRQRLLFWAISHLR
jgi:hypothetical protein